MDLLLVRRLPPLHANVGKRLAKSPKVFLRDRGLLHTLLHISDREALMAHPIVGVSWEGFALEQIPAVAPDGATGFFNRTSGGTEAYPVGHDTLAVPLEALVREVQAGR